MTFTSDGKVYTGFCHLGNIQEMPEMVAVVFWDGEYDLWAIECSHEALIELRRYYRVEREAADNMVFVTVYTVN